MDKPFNNTIYQQVSFNSKIPYADLKATQVLNVDDDSAVKFSTETVFYPDKYEIV